MFHAYMLVDNTIGNLFIVDTLEEALIICQRWMKDCGTFAKDEFDPRADYVTYEDAVDTLTNTWGWEQGGREFSVQIVEIRHKQSKFSPDGEFVN